nr:class I SAM-dependent methyltransferase [Parabacteroides goldsteinii]
MIEERTRETIDTYNKAAEKYQDKFMEMDLYDDTFNRFCSLIKKPEADILDIATGPGNVAKYLCSKHPDFKVLGIDLSSNMIELARKNVPQAEFAVMDCRNISTIGRKFDAVICAFGLPYLSKEESRKLISDAHLLLNPGGVLYISTMEGDYTRSGFETTSFSGQNRVFIYYHQEKFLTDCLRNAGFEIAELQRKDYPEPDGTFLTDMIFIAKLPATCPSIP